MPSEERPEILAALDTLRRDETETRARTDFATLAPSSRSLGANPYALAALGDGRGFVGILRGDSRVVLLDETLAERVSLTTAPSPSALALGAHGQVFVTGPLEHAVERFRVSGARLVAETSLAVPEAVALRALAADERALFAVDFAGDRLFAWSEAEARAVAASGRAPSELPACAGPIRLAVSPHFVAVACLFDHAVVLVARDARGLPEREIARVVHDGPIWSIALLERGGALYLAAGGVEDHPLERKDKVFGYVDSFAYLYSLRAGEAPGSNVTYGVNRLGATNVSALGVITPKAIALVADGDVPVTVVTGYGSATAVELAPGREPKKLASFPGCAALSVTPERRVCADPLLDAWVELDEAPRVHAARAKAPSDPTPTERLGEALFFTNLMAPDASSDGRLSRFTCETCHFEGGTDGRVHHSGRADVRVSTRPLFGLFNDGPHFSRAHDRDLTSVCQNEFAVANRGNPIDPWFSLDPARFPFLRELGVAGSALDPLALRRALFDFLARFSHEENPFVVAHASPRFSASEARGAATFRDRCARCHQPRLIANEPASLVPFERWETLTLSAATPIVWARGDYEKTGVEPYVESHGTRIPSLRRLYLKRPYLTNGSAKTLDALLETVRFSASSWFHEAPSDATDLSRLSSEERADLLAFLKLL
ncbi:MAG TPA: hypothetical protein VGQ57_14640 [Polyangiaceae bacterium]|nr:hypothetical protein [Polyangiaceae bacterium]